MIDTEVFVHTIDNIRDHQKDLSIVIRRRVVGSNNKSTYYLEQPLAFKLSDDSIILVPKGFVWDLSSVPRFLWGVLPPDGDFEVASLIHDFLYIGNRRRSYSRKFADDEMLLWSKAISGTQNKVSMRNLDNQIRYIAVRLFGSFVWNSKKNKNNI